jgi:hypothetical protein
MNKGFNIFYYYYILTSNNDTLADGFDIMSKLKIET